MLLSVVEVYLNVNESPNGDSSLLLFIIIGQIFDEQADIISLSVKDAINISSIITAAIEYKIIPINKVALTAEDVIREIEKLAYIWRIYIHICSIKYAINSIIYSYMINKLV